MTGLSRMGAGRKKGEDKAMYFWSWGPGHENGLCGYSPKKDCWCGLEAWAGPSIRAGLGGGALVVAGGLGLNFVVGGGAFRVNVGSFFKVGGRSLVGLAWPWAGGTGASWMEGVSGVLLWWWCVV